MLKCYRYHLGSLAFGSLIIAIVQMIRVLLEYVDAKLKGKENPVAKFFIKWVNWSFSSKKLSVQDEWQHYVFYYFRIVYCVYVCFFRCLKCCFWCLEKFLKFLNKNAYILVCTCTSFFVLLICIKFRKFIWHCTTSCLVHNLQIVCSIINCWFQLLFNGNLNAIYWMELYLKYRYICIYKRLTYIQDVSQFCMWPF